MVYCGKPAKSCRQCRNRNIKCDKKIPTCGQCNRASLSCPGYHNPENLVFRDETEAVIQKTFERDNAPLRPAIHPSIEIRAKYLFLSRHVLGHSPTLQFLPAFHQQRLYNLALASAAKAAIFAYFAAEVSCSSVLQTARIAYSSALIETSKVLQSPKNATNNCTLLIVILLDLIEKFMPQEQDHVGNEAKHLQGAIVLLKLRGENQFQDPLSMELFHHLSSRILYDCLKYGFEVPEDFVTLRNQAWIFADDTDQKWRLCEVMFRLIALQAGLKQRLISRLEVIESVRQLRNDSLHLQKGFMLDRADAMANGAADTCARFSIRRDLYFLLIRNVLDEITQECSMEPIGWEISAERQITSLDIYDSMII